MHTTAAHHQPRKPRPARIVRHNNREITVYPVTRPDTSFGATTARQYLLCQDGEGRYYEVTVRQKLWREAPLQITCRPLAAKYGLLRVAACERFERECGNDPTILAARRNG